MVLNFGISSFSKVHNFEGRSIIWYFLAKMYAFGYISFYF